MTRIAQYRCLRCGYKFEVEILTEDERREAQETNRPTSSVHCPKCICTDVLPSWD